MLHQLFALKRPLIVLDVETTGLDPKTARIVEIGFQIWTDEGMTKEWRSLVNPGVAIPDAVMKVHGISDAVLHTCRKCQSVKSAHPYSVHDSVCTEFAPWPSFPQLAPNLAKGFTDVDWAGKNVRFDLRMLASEFIRAGVEWNYLGARIVDADRLEQLGEPRHLAALYEKHVGRKMEEKAHQALADVRATTAVIEAQLKKYQQLPRDLDVLHAMQWPGHIDSDGKFRFVDGVPCFSQWGKYAGRPMREADRGYWQFILDKDFSADAKALARDALNGKFPEVKRD